jgi:two-component system sensor histidine kinase UhpB
MTFDWRMPRQWALAAALIIGAQLVFWGLVVAGERLARPQGMAHRPYVEFTVLDDAGRPLAEGRKFRAPYRPDPNYKTPITEGSARAIFEIPFTVENPDEGLALYLAVKRSLHEVRINGVVVQPNVPLDSFAGSAGWQPLFYMLPTTAIRPGENAITALVENEGYQHVFPEFNVGRAEDLARAFRWGNLLNFDLPLAAIAILAFSVLVCLVISWPREDRRRMSALTAFLAIWAIYTYWTTFTLPFEISRTVNFMAYWSLVFGALFSAGRYVLCDVDAPARWVRRLDIVWAATQAFCLLMPLMEGRLGPSLGAWFGIMLQASTLVSVVICGAAILLLAGRSAGRGGERWLERSLLMICLTALAVDNADSAYKLTIPFANDLPLTFYIAPAAGLLLGFGMVASLARQAASARRSVDSANLVLADRLAAQEAELLAGYETQKRMLARQVLLEERQRIVRDMHDGIGGQLLGLILQVRGRKVEPPEVEAALESSLSDLRLIVDSLDSAEDGLAAALRSVEHRIRGQVEAADVVLEVDHGLLDDDDKPLGARITLNIVRIVQEAVTNALRHSKGDRIRLESAAGPEGLTIRVTDNGVGLGTAVAAGRGLASMKTRAGLIGGRLDLRDAGPGLVVELTLPLDMPPTA